MMVLYLRQVERRRRMLLDTADLSERSFENSFFFFPPNEVFTISSHELVS